jgi:predicted PurR-regulated permease PerM
MGRSTVGPRRSRVGGWPIAAALAVLAVVLYAVRYALLPFVFAVAIAFVTDPLIATVQRRLGIARWPLAAFLYIALLAVTAAAIYLIGTTAITDLGTVVAHAPEIVRHLAAQALGAQGVTIFGRNYTSDQLVNSLFAGLAKLVGVDFAARIAGSGVSVVFGAFLTLVLTPYFMISGPRLAAGAIWLIPPERRHSVLEVLP